MISNDLIRGHGYSVKKIMKSYARKLQLSLCVAILLFEIASDILKCYIKLFISRLQDTYKYIIYQNELYDLYLFFIFDCMFYSY